MSHNFSIHKSGRKTQSLQPTNRNACTTRHAQSMQDVMEVSDLEHYCELVFGKWPENLTANYVAQALHFLETIKFRLQSTKTFSKNSILNITIVFSLVKSVLFW